MRIGFLRKTYNIDFIARSKQFFIVSIIVVLLSISFMFIKGLNLGVDFKGGMVVDVQNAQNKQDLIINYLEEKGFSSVSVREFDITGLQIILSSHDIAGYSGTASLIDELRVFFADNGMDYLQSQLVGPSISAELVRGSIFAIVFSLLGIFVYLWVRFDWQYGIVAVVTLIQNLLCCLLFLTIFRYEVDVSVIAALLTVLGYSINDTIVVFDQIRENVKKYIKEDIKVIINKSLNSILSRSLALSITLIVVLVGIFFFAGKSLQAFSFVMFIGVVFGTYSSICIASLLLPYVGDIKNRNIKIQNAVK